MSETPSSDQLDHRLVFFLIGVTLVVPSLHQLGEIAQQQHLPLTQLTLGSRRPPLVNCIVVLLPDLSQLTGSCFKRGLGISDGLEPR